MTTRIAAQRLTREELDYQVNRHVRMHMLQWPHSDRDAVRVDTRRRLLAGQAWLWPAPAQMDLFGEAA